MSNLLKRLQSTKAGTNIIVAATSLLFAVEHLVTDLSEAHWQAGAIVAAGLAWINARIGITES